MPRKDKGEYNEYMRNYMKKRQRELKGQPILDNDYNPSSVTNDKPTLDLNSAAGLVKQTRELLKSEKGNPEAEDDPVLKMIDKYGKYVPLVIQFFQGFQAAAKDFQQTQKPQQQIQAPAGWLSMSPMQKLGYKYTRPEWYAAGEAYDVAVETGNMNPQINTSYVDPTYRSAEPQNLQQLSRKYPEPPPVKDETPIQEVAKTEEIKKEEIVKKDQDLSEVPTQQNEIVAELQADNRKYIQMGIDYINRMSDEDFKKNIDDIDSLVEKGKPFIPFIPVHVKAMIMQSKKEEIEEIFKNGCPQKYAILQKSKKVKKLLDLFEALKKLL